MTHPMNLLEMIESDTSSSITLSATQLMSALQFVAPDYFTDADQREAEIVISRLDTGKFSDGEPRPAGIYAWLAEYPEEGCIPLLTSDQAFPWFDLVAHIRRQSAFSLRTFGSGQRVDGVTDHIAKELQEVRDSGGDLAEWVDVIILGLDGAWRSGASPEQIVAALEAKQTKNEGRRWPDWRTAPEGKAIEHDRSQDGARP